MIPVERSRHERLSRVRGRTPAGARFCPCCGVPLAEARPEATERKVVTTLFADLVEYTAFGERHDPEDVDAALRAYFDLARTIIERFGGVVEKFIGDAVVGLFGVPAAHEDDAERAVRAALEIVTRMRELPVIGGERLQVRCGVNTGTALVRLDVLPRSGEGLLVGDAVNTCARLLSDAPAMGVVAGTMTQRLSSRDIAYEQLPAVRVKGKERPVQRWLARGPVGRRGIDTRESEHTHGGSRSRARHTARALGQGDRFRRSTVRDRRRRGGHRQDPSPPGDVPRSGRTQRLHLHLAPGALPAIWRGPRVLGARRDLLCPRRNPAERRTGGHGAETPDRLRRRGGGRVGHCQAATPGGPSRSAL